MKLMINLAGNNAKYLIKTFVWSLIRVKIFKLMLVDFLKTSLIFVDFSENTKIQQKKYNVIVVKLICQTKPMTLIDV